MPVDHASICRAVEARGLQPRGAFHPTDAEDVPAMADGREAGTVVRDVVGAIIALIIISGFCT